MSIPNRDAGLSSSPQSQTPSMTSHRSSLDTSRSSIDASRSPRLGHSTLQIQNPSSAAQHRQSIGGYPSSPRQQRQPSVSSIAVQDLIDNPPAGTNVDTRFAHRDWRSIKVGELTTPEDLKFIDIDSSVEEATNVCQLS